LPSQEGEGYSVSISSSLHVSMQTCYVFKCAAFFPKFLS
jgi:hypothetical protein